MVFVRLIGSCTFVAIGVARVNSGRNYGYRKIRLFGHWIYHDAHLHHSALIWNIPHLGALRTLAFSEMRLGVVDATRGEQYKRKC